MKKVSIESFNPYKARFPNHKVISRETLILIKKLRQEGVEVEVLPNDKRPLYYTFRKGFIDYLQDPITAYLINVSTSFVINIITSIIYEKAKNRAERKRLLTKNADKILIIQNEKLNEYYSIHQKKLNKKAKKKIIELQKKKELEYFETTISSPPNSDLPYPIFLEHASRIVGWGKLRVANDKLLLDDFLFTDNSIYGLIEKEKIKGLSVAGLATKATCSICKLNYVTCNHIAKEVYNDRICTVTIERSLLSDISLVEKPINQNCIIRILSKNKN